MVSCSKTCQLFTTRLICSYVATCLCSHNWHSVVKCVCRSPSMSVLSTSNFSLKLVIVGILLYVLFLFMLVFLVFKACNYSIFVFYLHRYIFPLFQIMSVSGTSHRKCLNIPDSFCYIWGSFIIPSHMKNISTFVNKTYFAYLKVKLGDQDKSWGPHKVCKQWVDSLRMWTKGTLDKLAFVIPMLWREQKHHCTDCYFCLVKTSRFNKKKKSKIEYPNLPSAIRPVPHLDEILVEYLL